MKGGYGGSMTGGKGARSFGMTVVFSNSVSLLGEGEPRIGIIVEHFVDPSCMEALKSQRLEKLDPAFPMRK